MDRGDRIRRVVAATRRAFRFATFAAVAARAPLAAVATLAPVAAAVALSPVAAVAQEWPTRPVRVLIGFAPGGPADVLARILSDYFGKTTGQPFVVESRPGAAGVLAGQILAATPPDGYTIHVMSFAIVGAAKAMHADMTYDPATAFAPITLLVRAPMVLEVSSAQPVTTFAEFATWARANTGKLNHGSPGVGTLPHLASELFKEMIGFESQHIPYRGSGPFAQGMMQKELQWSFDSANTAIQLLRGGHVRFLAVSTRERWAPIPDVPTLHELGMKDAVWPTWFGLVTVAGTPRAIIDRVRDGIAAAWKLPDYIARVHALGFEPAITTAEETAALFAEERERWTPVIRRHNIKAQ
ncbi:MAG: tripartite tricarboxylate transporter substrate binding protein [Alphaproteobacteria bacterium]|nr:tripartite tricarboxylate transporter substrate binding protein [Alphaproteobacteria bacterium]